MNRLLIVFFAAALAVFLVIHNTLSYDNETAFGSILFLSFSFVCYKTQDLKDFGTIWMLYKAFFIVAIATLSAGYIKDKWGK